MNQTHPRFNNLLLILIRLSAKRRIMKAVRRRLPSVDRVEIFEEDAEDGEERSDDDGGGGERIVSRPAAVFRVDSVGDRDRHLVSCAAYYKRTRRYLL